MPAHVSQGLHTSMWVGTRICTLEPIMSTALHADNLWALKGWCRKSFEGMEADMEVFFQSNGYSEDMDYV